MIKTLHKNLVITLAVFFISNNIMSLNDSTVKTMSASQIRLYFNKLTDAQKLTLTDDQLKYLPQSNRDALRPKPSPIITPLSIQVPTNSQVTQSSTSDNALSTTPSNPKDILKNNWSQAIVLAKQILITTKSIQEIIQNKPYSNDKQKALNDVYLIPLDLEKAINTPWIGELKQFNDLNKLNQKATSWILNAKKKFSIDTNALKKAEPTALQKQPQPPTITQSIPIVAAVDKAAADKAAADKAAADKAAADKAAADKAAANKTAPVAPTIPAANLPGPNQDVFGRISDWPVNGTVLNNITSTDTFAAEYKKQSSYFTDINNKLAAQDATYYDLAIPQNMQRFKDAIGIIQAFYAKRQFGAAFDANPIFTVDDMSGAKTLAGYKIAVPFGVMFDDNFDTATIDNKLPLFMFILWVYIAWFLDPNMNNTLKTQLVSAWQILSYMLCKTSPADAKITNSQN